jgi:hypothetical protein
MLCRYLLYATQMSLMAKIASNWPPKEEEEDEEKPDAAPPETHEEDESDLDFEAPPKRAASRAPSPPEDSEESGSYE